PTAPLTRQDWLNAMANAMSFILNRNAVLLNQLRADGLLPALGAPAFSPFGGNVPPRLSAGSDQPERFRPGAIHPEWCGSGPSLARLSSRSPTTIAPLGPSQQTTRVSLLSLSTPTPTRCPTTRPTGALPAPLAGRRVGMIRQRPSCPSSAMKSSPTREQCPSG